MLLAIRKWLGLIGFADSWLLTQYVSEATLYEIRRKALD